MVEAGARPRAWGVLAVALALMALVVALSSTTGRPPAARSASRRTQGNHRQAGDVKSGSGERGRRVVAPGFVAAHAQAREGTAAQKPATDPPQRPEPTAGSTGPSLVGSLGLEHPGPGSDTPDVTVPTADDAGSRAVGEPSVGTGAAPPPSAPGAPTPTGHAGGATYPGGGRLGPSSGSSTFPAAGGGVVSAEASWTGTSALELSVSCPGGVATSRTGAAPLSVEVDDGAPSGTCQVSLSLPPGVTADVTFALVIEPGP